MFWLKNDVWKKKSTLFQSGVLENIKIYCGRPLLNRLHGVVILVKVNEMYNILKILLANRYWSKDKGGIGWSKFLLESGLECPHVYYIPALLRSRLPLLVTISYYFFHKI